MYILRFGFYYGLRLSEWSIVKWLVWFQDTQLTTTLVLALIRGTPHDKPTTDG